MVGSPDRPFKRIKRVKGNYKEFDSLSQMISKRIRQMYGDNREKILFDNPVIILKDKEEITKMQEFEKYIENFLRCANCMKQPVMEHVGSDSTNLVFTCQTCFCTTTDSTKEAQEFVKWFNSVLSRFSQEFTKMPNYIVGETKEEDGSGWFHEWCSNEYTGDYEIRVPKKQK